MRRLAWIGVLLALTALAAAPAAAGELRLLTGPIGGSWYPLGGAIAEAVKKKFPAIAISVGPGGGIANVKAIETGKADLGFGNTASTVDAAVGRDPFPEKVKNVRYLAMLYRQYFQVVVREDAGIKTVADLKGKSIAPGPKGFTGEQMARHVLQVYGLSYADMGKVHHVGYSDAVALMKDGHVDAFLPVTTIPASAIIDLATARKIRLLSLPDDKVRELQRTNSGYTRNVVAAGTYPGVGYEVVNIGTYTDLLVSAALPDDVVYSIARAVVEGRDQLALVVREIGQYAPKDMAPDLELPYHPGALRYYREVKAK